MMRLKHVLFATWILGVVVGGSSFADQRLSAGSNEKSQKAAKRLDGLIPLNKRETVLLDTQGKRVLIKSKVVLREGMLEMFACPKQTKEHESILAVDAKAYAIHAGLLVIGAKPGKPVQFYKPDPEEPRKYVEDYNPPTGQRLNIFVQWKDQQGKRHRVSAKSWVRHAINRFYVEKMDLLPRDLTIPEKGDLRMLRYDERHKELSWFGSISEKQRDQLMKLSSDQHYCKAINSFFKQCRPREMEADWIFAGSRFFKDEKTQKQYYEAEGGTLICVANFPSAMIDVSQKSSDKQDEGVLFEAYTKRIPPLETEVTIELIPVFEKLKKTR